MEKQDEICLPIIFKAKATVCVLQKNYLLSESCIYIIIPSGTTKLPVVCVKMLLKEGQAWFILGTCLIGSSPTTAT